MNSGFFGFPNILGLLRATAFRAIGKPGAQAGAELAGGTTSGAPTSGEHAVGELVVDHSGTLWICTGAGTPGTWTQVVGGSGSYTLPVATPAVLGGVKPGSGLAVATDGTLRAGGTPPAAHIWPQAISTAAPTTVATATIIADGTYNQAPSFTVRRDGTFLVVYRESTADVATGGKITVQTSADGGATWSSKSYPLSTPGGHDYRDPDVCTTATGRLVLAFTDTQNETNDYVVKTAYSDDNGTTWSTPATQTGFSLWTYHSGNILQHSAGALLLPLYGKNSGDSDTRCGVLRSLDDGLTWSAVVTMGAASTGYNEQGLIELPDHSITSYIRIDGASVHIYTSSSTDQGVTWTTPAALSFTVRGGRPMAILVPVSQELILFYRSTTGPSNVVYRWSADLGATWSSEISLVAHPYIYAGAAPLEDHLVGICYAYETVSDSQATVAFLSLSAGVPTVSGSRSANAAVASLLSGLAQRGAVIDGTTAGTAPLTDPTTTKGDLIAHGSSTTRLPVGSDGQTLQADSTQTLGVKWAAASSYTDPLTTEGDVPYRHSGSTTRLAIGATAGHALLSNATDPLWGDAAASGPTRWEPITAADGTCLITSALDPVMALASTST